MTTRPGPGLLAEHLGAAAVTVHLGGVELGMDAVGPISISHGRRDVDEQPQAAVCSLGLRSTALPALPEIGDFLAVELGADALAALPLSSTDADLARHRFLGTVTDVAFEPRNSAHGPGTVRVTATSLRARLGRHSVGAEPWPAETDGERAGRILALAAPAVGLTVGLVDPGTVTVAARDVDDQPALQLLDELAAGTAALLVDRRDGSLEWHDAEHRRGATPVADLDASQVLTETVPKQRLAGLVNDLTVTWTGGSTRLVDTDSADPITGYGPFRSTLQTPITDQAQAESLALLTIGRKARPWWDIGDGLAVELLRSVDLETAAGLLTAEVGDVLRISGFPADGPFELRLLAVEGWQEVITRHAWRVDYAVSDLELTGPAARWVDVRPDALTWFGWDGAYPDAGRWLDTVGYRPVYGAGLWVDLPARDRWATHTPDTTWADAPTT